MKLYRVEFHLQVIVEAGGVEQNDVKETTEVTAATWNKFHPKFYNDKCYF